MIMIDQILIPHAVALVLFGITIFSDITVNRFSSLNRV
jgi:hypothetical protein